MYSPSHSLQRLNCFEYIDTRLYSTQTSGLPLLSLWEQVLCKNIFCTRQFSSIYSTSLSGDAYLSLSPLPKCSTSPSLNLQYGTHEPPLGMRAPLAIPPNQIKPPFCGHPTNTDDLLSAAFKIQVKMISAMRKEA